MRSMDVGIKSKISAQYLRNMLAGPINTWKVGVNTTVDTKLPTQSCINVHIHLITVVFNQTLKQSLYLYVVQKNNLVATLLRNIDTTSFLPSCAHWVVNYQ